MLYWVIELMDINATQRHKLRQFVQELKQYRTNHTEMVTVYIPAGYELTKIIGHLSDEAGTASNIKSTSTRKNVQAALEKMIQHLRLYKQTPPNGLLVFSGNVSAREGQQDVRVWSLEPPVPVSMRTYRCDKEFMLDFLEDLMLEKTLYGLVVIDRRDANIAFLRGKTIVPLMKTHSEVPGKFKAGGQCLVKDTFIQSCDGNIISIHNSHNPCVVKSMINDHSLIDSPITDRWNVKKSSVYTITTKAPRLQVQASKDHVFFVQTSSGIVEKAAEELHVGDLLIMPEIIEVSGRIQTLKPIQYYNSFVISLSGQTLLRHAREEKRLLQKELAKLIDVTQTTIPSYELGKIHADRICLQKLCAALGIDFYEFLNVYTTPYLYRAVKLPAVVEHNLAKFLGYLIGDGCIETDRITFFEQNQQVALRYKELFDSYFNIECTYLFKDAKNYHQLRFTSRPLVRLIRSEFPEIKKSVDTIIPGKILKSPPEIISSFLKGLFDADGYVSRHRIGLGINNKQFAQQVQLTLLRFSIISSLHEYDNRSNVYSKNHRFTIGISEKASLELFERHIGFTADIKRQGLARAISSKTSRSNVRQILTPGAEIRKTIEAAGYNLQLFPKVTNFFRNERMISKEAFKHSILAYVKDERLYSELIKSYTLPFLPVKISYIEQREEEVDMVDISVGNQNFIANGVIVHNSAQRFERQIEGAAKQHYRKVAEYMKEQFLGMKELKGILVGGPGPTKHDFIELGQLTGELKQKIIAIRDLGYTGEFGLQELVDKSQDVLAEEEIAVEKKIMTDFLERLAKAPEKASYGKAAVERAIELGAVDILLLSESLDDDTIQKLTDATEKMGGKAIIISVETREGVQLKELGGIAAMLRFAV